MRLINGADEEMFQTVTLATKLGKADRVIERLSERSLEEWDNPEAGFPYALATMAALQASGSDLEKHAGYYEAIGTLTDVLENCPDHWLASYCRVRLRSLVPAEYGLYRDYLSNEQDTALAEAAALIEAQSTVEWQPYFASPYLLAAHLHLNRGQDDTAGDLVRRAAERPTGPVGLPALGAILSEPFVAVHQRTGPRLRDVVGRLMSELFADQSAVRTELHRAPVG